MIKKIRILEVINDATIGGGQRHVFFLADGLDKNIFDVRVACSNNGPLVEALRALGIPVFTLDISRKMNLKSLLGLRRILREQRIHIVHLHGGVAGFWGRLAAAWARTPIWIYTLHGIHYLYYKNPIQRTAFIVAERLLANWTHRIICVSVADRNAGLRAGCFTQRQSLEIQNGIPIPSLPRDFDSITKKKELGIPADAQVIGTVGRFHFQKGQRTLLEAARLVIREIPNVIVLLVGDGPMRNELEQLARDSGIRERVHFMGFRQDVSELLAVMDVFVLPSEWEGLPFSLLEAMALARPVVAHAIDGVMEIVKDGYTGVLVPPRKPEALAKEIVYLLHDRAYANRLAARGREHVLAKFGQKKMVCATAALYKELCKFVEEAPCVSH